MINQLFSVVIFRSRFLSVLLFIIFILILIQKCEFNSNSRQPKFSKTTSAPPSPKVSTEDRENYPTSQVYEEKKYIEAAGGFLKTMHEQDIRLANVMAGLRTGTSTLGMIRDEIDLAQMVESAGYHKVYKTAQVPSEYQTIDEKIQLTYRLHNAALEEMLEYWKDANEAHIESGMNSLERSILLLTECIAELNRKLKAK